PSSASCRRILTNSRLAVEEPAFDSNFYLDTRRRELTYDVTVVNATVSARCETAVGDLRPTQRIAPKRAIPRDDGTLASASGCCMDSPSASSGRGFTRASIFARNGRLVASTAQESLIRVRRSGAAAHHGSS